MMQLNQKPILRVSPRISPFLTVVNTRACQHQHRQAQLICRNVSGATSITALSDGLQPESATDPAPTAAGAVNFNHQASPEKARAIVDEVLAAIEGTDSGMAMSPEKRTRVDELLEQLETIGKQQRPRPLENPLLWGNYNVAYTSVASANQRGEPAGGRFRGPIGRALFRTAGLFQSVLQPDIATNKVEFKLFGFLPGYVGLRGRVAPTGEGGDTVQVLFEPPVLSIADSLHLRIGKPSSVVLSTTYLDERVRLGKGSRGSLFVFTRGGAAESADMDKVGLQSTTFAAAAVFTVAFLSLFISAAALWVSGQLVLKGVAIAMWLLGAAIAGIVRQGGLVLARDDDSALAKAKAAIEQRDRELTHTKKAETETNGTEMGGAGAAATAAA